jgi:hypothetical protein
MQQSFGNLLLCYNSIWGTTTIRSFLGHSQKARAHSFILLNLPLGAGAILQVIYVITKMLIKDH